MEAELQRRRAEVTLRKEQRRLNYIDSVHNPTPSSSGSSSNIPTIIASTSSNLFDRRRVLTTKPSTSTAFPPPATFTSISSVNTTCIGPVQPSITLSTEKNAAPGLLVSRQPSLSAPVPPKSLPKNSTSGTSSIPIVSISKSRGVWHLKTTMCSSKIF
ncbi:unnamed protein product [Protopolystoma xenopodis]|uniref:Uncharacterized protein n=1 Tax=Protopolystoma xenopodis TaxID=117903 RepID=A0A448WGN7_9PLAT|nr:unnamed protein product [Protopolystoma xenopodis]